MTAPRNVVIFVADDLGWGDLGCYGALAIPTPRLDALAAGGLRYTDAHAASAVCSPSRYSLLTGEYPWRSPLQRSVLGGADPCIIRPGQATLARALGGTGRATGAFGKWHLGLGWTRSDGTRRTAFGQHFAPDMQATGNDIDYAVPFVDGPLAHGFERFFGIAGSLDMPPYCYLDQDRTVGIPDRPKVPLITSQRPGPQVENWQDDRVDLDITDVACDWIAARLAADEPFFAYIASAAPHRPCVPPSFVHGLSSAGARGDAVCLVDWMMGRVIDELNHAGALDDTLVIFTSDNGAPMIFPEDGDVEIHRPNGPWRGQKADAWEGGHRVPLIISGPGVPVGVIDEPTSLLDLAPLITQLCGAGDLEGDGAVPMPFGSSEPRIFGQQAFDGTLAVRSGMSKAILSDGSGGFSDPVGEPLEPTSSRGQFYDLGSDPAERENQWTERHAEALALLQQYFSQTGFVPPEAR